MTTLDFTNYKNGLRKFNFSNDFISRKIKGYKVCIDNLANVSFESFLKYELDEHEQLQCAFPNTYEWSGGMEPIKSARLSKIMPIAPGKVIVEVDLYYSPKSFHKGIYTFVKSGRHWTVDDFVLE